MLMTKKSTMVILVSIYWMGTIIFLGISFIDDTLVGSNNYSQTPYQQVFAQNAASQESDDISSNITANASSSDESIHRQGLILSSKSGPNETAQVALILPHRADGMLYSGVLTYSASSPVEIALLSRVNIDNETLSQIIGEYDESSPNWIDLASSIHNLTELTPQIIGSILPDYGPSTPYYSASIPFVASGVGLWSPGDKPFLVSYQLSAKLVNPETVNRIDFNDVQ